ncbi:MAG TPA: hypothetical protein VK588_01705 [Chitinophagaceae bacterium]|nr:hypothetical protein [Chitinophagaceae bacterium]
MELSKEYVKDRTPKNHNFWNHMRGAMERAKLNDSPLQKQPFRKRQIYVVRYGMNDGSEINGDRPSIIYKASHSTL